MLGENTCKASVFTSLKYIQVNTALKLWWVFLLIKDSSVSPKDYG